MTKWSNGRYPNASKSRKLSRERYSLEEGYNLGEETRGAGRKRDRQLSQDNPNASYR